MQPFSMAFLPDGAILITERPGRFAHRAQRRARTHARRRSAGGSGARLDGIDGLGAPSAVRRKPLIYFTYNKPAASGDGKQTGGGLTLARGRWDGAAITNFQDLFTAGPNTNASRMIFGRDGMIYMSAGVADPPQAERAQDPNDLAGKVLRLRDDGTVPPDNPFVNRTGYRPEIYTMGHRTVLGLTLQPDTGVIWECEDGPNSGDEVNILAPGKNHGWPVVSYGRFYAGPRVSVNP
jgi:glucose/arabinose dehydrogenase